MHIRDTQKCNVSINQMWSFWYKEGVLSHFGYEICPFPISHDAHQVVDTLKSYIKKRLVVEKKNIQILEILTRTAERTHFVWICGRNVVVFHLKVKSLYSSESAPSTAAVWTVSATPPLPPVHAPTCLYDDVNSLESTQKKRYRLRLYRSQVLSNLPTKNYHHILTFGYSFTLSCIDSILDNWEAMWIASLNKHWIPQ